MPFISGNWIIQYELNQMERYLGLLQTTISDNQKQFNASIEKTVSTMTEDEKEDFYQFHEDDFIEVSRDFPRQLFSSFVVSWYSFVENRLMNFCKSRNLKISLSIQDNENYGKGIKRAYNFLYRAAGYKIDNEYWNELTRIRKTRNKIVHNNGRLSFSSVNMPNNSVSVDVASDVTLYLQIDKDLYQYIETHNLLEYIGVFYITPNFEYCKHLVDFGLEFFERLHKDFRKETQTE